MAYLTNYNLSQLSLKIPIKDKVSMEMFLEKVYNDLVIYYILNKLDVEFLFKYKMLLMDENKFLIEYYNEIPVKEDSKNLVYNKGGKIKYHLSTDCKLISKDYLDFAIPEDIKSKGDESISEYREWFSKNDFGLKFQKHNIDISHIIRAFNLKYPAKYNISPIEENSNLLVLTIPKF